MSNELDSGPVCDFCDLAVEEDEELVPMYIGTQPTPRKRILSETRKKKSRYLLGKSSASYIALYEALQNCPDIRVKLSEAVCEPSSMKTWEEINSQPVTGDMSSDHTVNHDKCGARVIIEPRSVNSRPDAEFCDTCAERFRNL